MIIVLRKHKPADRRGRIVLLNASRRFFYVPTWQDLVFVAFVIDVFARRIVGWRVSSSQQTQLFLMRWSRPCWHPGPGRRP